MKSFTEKLESILEFGGTKKDILFLIFGGISLLLSLANINILPFDMAWIAIILCGVPIILEAIIGLITEFDIKADVLVSLALIASVLIREDFAAGEVAFIMQLGALLEDLTVAKARSGIEKLVKLTPQTARVIYNNDNIEIIPAQTVKVGQRLRVFAGETIPVDGNIPPSDAEGKAVCFLKTIDKILPREGRRTRGLCRKVGSKLQHTEWPLCAYARRLALGDFRVQQKRHCARSGREKRLGFQGEIYTVPCTKIGIFLQIKTALPLRK